MKKILYIFWVITFVSCNNTTEKNSSYEDAYNEFPDLEIEEVVAEKEIISDDYDKPKENFQYEELSQQKLQEMYDLLALQNSSPEFLESVNLQLKNYTTSTDNFSSTGDVKIANLELIREVYPASDTISKIKIHYDIVSKNKVKKDSVWATITSSFVSFEGETIISKKVKFSKVIN